MPPPSIPERLDALEQAVALAQARRLLLLQVLHRWMTDPDQQAVLDYIAHLEERLAEEGP